MRRKILGLTFGLLMIGIASAIYTVHNMTWETEVLEPFEVLWLSDLHFGGGNCLNEEINCSEWYPSNEVFHWIEPPETYERMMYPGDYTCHCFVVLNWGMADIDLELDIDNNENVEFTAQYGNLMTIPADSIPIFFWIKAETPTDAVPGLYDINIEFNRI